MPEGLGLSCQDHQPDGRALSSYRQADTADTCAGKRLRSSHRAISTLFQRDFLAESLGLGAAADASDAEYAINDLDS